MSEIYLCPPSPHKILSPDAVLAVGFGMVIVSYDDEHVWVGDDEDVTVGDIETLVVEFPEGEWTIEYVGPLQGTTYTRTQNGWVLTDRNMGFA